MNRILPISLLATLFAAVLLPALPAQEEITLNSGDVLKGKVLASTAEKLILRLPDGKMRTLKMSEIKSRKKSKAKSQKSKAKKPESQNPKSQGGKKPMPGPEPQKPKLRPGLAKGEVRSGEVQGVKFQANGELSEKLARALALSLVNSAKQNKAPLPMDEITVLENGRLYLRLTPIGARTLQAEPDRYIAFLKHILALGRTAWPQMAATVEEPGGKVVATATRNTPGGDIRVEINPGNR